MSVTNASDKIVNSSCCSEAPSAAHAGGTLVEVSRAQEPSLAGDLSFFVRYWLRDRRVLIGIAAVALVGGAALNWGWLVAVGAAPLILALAPCAAMCALGMCMKGKGKEKAVPGQSATAGDGLPLASQPARREPDVDGQ